MKRFHYALTLLLFVAGVTRADGGPFGTEFTYSQQSHPKATGRLKEGYRIHSYFHFLIPRTRDKVDWNSLKEGYLARVRQGFSNQPGDGNDKRTAKARALLPCDVQYIFFKAKEVERRGDRQGFEKLSSPERAVYNFSKKYIRDPRLISFSRQLFHGEQPQWSRIASHYGRDDKPVLVLGEYLRGFNQFVIEGRVLFLVVHHSETEYAVYGDISLTLDADILDQRVIGLFLSLPVKASLKGLLPTKVVFNKVAEKLKTADFGSGIQCNAAESSENSLIYGVPNFTEGYLQSLRRYLVQNL